MTDTHPPDTERIAVVGMAGRFPKADDLDAFWQNLCDGVECITFTTDGEGDRSHDAADARFVPAGGALDGIDLFDAAFFGYSARDAEMMDPQQRVFLECAWHSLESAGYDPGAYEGLVGVFAGAAASFYMMDLYALAPSEDFQIAIGNDRDHLTTQVAYKLNLRGPSMTVQTACSTSLVAVCMACESLLNYQCDMALAGGVALDDFTREGYYYEQGGILSPDGHCRAFDAAAQGTVPGNGVGIVVLKRLSEAVADRDPIRAVITGFALNNDGSRKVGYTAPSVEGQAEVIAMAHAVAGVEPESITYVEAHGTGTALGDPIEIAALDQVFGARTSRRGYCAIGSVKSNLGHLDTAAGVAGLIKTVLALEHRRIPPSLHFERPNPEIDFADSAFRVNTELTEWSANGAPLRAGVSSFGIGGTNAHVVLEQAPEVSGSPPARPCSLLTVSARSAAALDRATAELADHLLAHPEAGLADVAYTGHVGRRAFSHRRVLVADGAADAGAALAERDPRRVRTRECRPGGRHVAFLLPGQGTQFAGMAAELYRVEPVFRREVDGCAELLRPLLGRDLRELLHPPPETEAEAAQALGRTAWTQPAVFTIEYALARQWMAWGVRPVAMLGHSIGEWVAACLAGVISLPDALAVVSARGRLMDAMAPGAMLAIALSESALAEHVTDGLALAAVNGPAACVLSGPSATVDGLQAELSARGVQAQRLATSHAFHSPMMDPALGEFVDVVRGVALHPPQVPFVSDVTGTWIAPEQATDPLYWGRQLRETVRFADGLQELAATPEVVLLEVGPGRTLATLARRNPGLDARQPVLSSLLAAREGTSDVESMVSTLGELWLHGVDPDWSGFHAHEARRRVPLPLYAFERQRYWVGAEDEEPIAEENAPLWAAEQAAGWFSLPSWMPSAPSAPAEQASRRWIVLGDGSPLTRGVVNGLRRQGHEVATVTTGEAFAQTAEGAYAIRRSATDDYERLLARVRPDAVAHLWAAESPPGDEHDRAAFRAHQDAGFHSLVALAQAVDRLGFKDPLEVDVVSGAVHAVIGSEKLCPAKATAIGACRVVPQEHPNVRCRFIDIEPAGCDPASVLAELTAEPFEPTVAYRNGRRWVQAFDAATLDAPGARGTRAREGGVYLITGGLGNIGSVLAASLAGKTAGVKLILTGRSSLPAENEWQACLDAEPDSAASERIRRVLELRAATPDVVYFSADVADAQAMARVVAEAEERFGPLTGVIHGAGDTEAYVPLVELDAEAAERQFAPKAAGLLVLDELLRGRPLDFWLLLSSLSSLVGGVGLAAYAAANGYLDALAAHRNQEGGTPWINVNWGQWRFPDEDGGEAEEVILPDAGQAAFEAILSRAPRQIVVSPADLQALYEQAVSRPAQASPPSDEPATRAAAHDRPDLSTPYVEPRTRTDEQLAEIWQELLGVAPVGVFDHFFELGGHSLLAIKLSGQVRRAFGLEMPVTRVFDHPTIADLAGWIERESEAQANDEARAAEVLDLLEDLSDGEVRALIERDET
jgi:acyl transferase domain-containing protein